MLNFSFILNFFDLTSSRVFNRGVVLTQRMLGKHEVFLYLLGLHESVQYTLLERNVLHVQVIDELGLLLRLHLRDLPLESAHARTVVRPDARLRLLELAYIHEHVHVNNLVVLTVVIL